MKDAKPREVFRLDVRRDVRYRINIWSKTMGEGVTKVYFYCDESGAKGYASQDESFPGEVGVFAGILVPEERLAAVKSEFDQIASRYTPADGKLHIADLAPNRQDGLRSEIFDAIKRAKLPCFWYAIHVAGFHAFHKQAADAIKKASENLRIQRGGVGPRVKQGSPREDPVSLHVELFSGLYSHLVAFLSERNKSGVDIEIRTDKVDVPIRGKFIEGAEELLNNDPSIQKSTGFDTVKKEVVTGTLTTTVKWPADLDFSPVVNSLSIETRADSDGLVLAADVLANSLNYLFIKRGQVALYGPLNCRQAVAGHPLADHLDAFLNWGNGDLVGDGLYQHPGSRSKHP